VRRQLRGQGKKVDGKKAAPSVVVASVLRADLPLKATGPEDLLVQAHQFQEKLKAADLGGTKELKKATPQEEELLEELEGMGMPEDQGPARGEAVFFFVSRISEADQAAALAQAYQKARAEAAKLARAAGQELGVLQQLNTVPGMNSGDDEMALMDGGPANYQYLQRYRWIQSRTGGRPDEALGIQPGKVVFRVSVSASFALKAAPPG